MVWITYVENREMIRYTEKGLKAIRGGSLFITLFFFFATQDFLSVILAGSHLMKYMLYSFLEFEIIINEVLSRLAHFQAPGSIF